MRLCERLIKTYSSRLVSECLFNFKAVADELGLLNKSVEEDDLTLYIVNGLSHDLEDISTTLRSRDTSISFEELHENLVEHESYLKRLDLPSKNVSVTANSIHKIDYGFLTARKRPWVQCNSSISSNVQPNNIC